MRAGTPGPASAWADPCHASSPPPSPPSAALLPPSRRPPRRLPAALSTGCGQVALCATRAFPKASPVRHVGASSSCSSEAQAPARAAVAASPPLPRLSPSSDRAADRAAPPRKFERASDSARRFRRQSPVRRRSPRSPRARHCPHPLARKPFGHRRAVLGTVRSAGGPFGS